MKVFKNLLLTLAIILLMGILAALVAFGLASSDVNDDVFTAEPSNELATELAKTVVTQSEYTIGENSLNSYLAYVLSSAKTDDDMFCVTDIFADLSGSTSKCCVRIKKGEFTFTVVFDCEAEIKNDKIAVSLGNAYVGKLPLPDWAVKKLLEKTKLSLSSGYIDSDDLTILFPTHYGLELFDLGELVSLDILTLSVSDDCMTITTNPVISDSMENAAGMIMDKLGEFIDGF